MTYRIKDIEVGDIVKVEEGYNDFTLRHYTTGEVIEVFPRSEEIVIKLNSPIMGKARYDVSSVLRLYKRSASMKEASELLRLAKEVVAGIAEPRTKPVRLTQSEIANAETSYGGKRYTIIRRPQPDGRFWIAAIDVDNGRVLYEEYADGRMDVQRAIREVNRWLDKLAMGGPMSDVSRHRGITKTSKEVVAARQHIDVKSLPQGIQNALKHIPYHNRDIEVDEATSYAPSMASSSWEGNRGFLMVVDIRSGRIEESLLGSWGGSNMFESKPVDVDKTHRPIPNNHVVIYGSSGGRGPFATILVRPDDKGLLITEEVSEIDLTDDEKKALRAINGIKSGYRADEFRRDNLGEYSTSNPLIQSLEKKGLLQFMASGIRVTIAGKNAYNKIRGW